MELAAQAVQGLQLALAADVRLVHSEILAAALFCQEAARLAASYLGPQSGEADGQQGLWAGGWQSTYRE